MPHSVRSDIVSGISPIAGDTQPAPAGGCRDLEGWPIVRFSLSRPLFLPSSFRPPVTHPDGVTPRPKRYPAKSSSRRKWRWGAGGRDINSGRGRHVVLLSLIFAQRRHDFFPRPRAQGCNARADPHPSFLFSRSIPSPRHPSISVTLLSSFSAPIFMGSGKIGSISNMHSRMRVVFDVQISLRRFRAFLVKLVRLARFYTDEMKRSSPIRMYRLKSAASRMMDN